MRKILIGGAMAALLLASAATAAELPPATISQAPAGSSSGAGLQHGDTLVAPEPTVPEAEGTGGTAAHPKASPEESEAPAPETGTEAQAEGGPQSPTEPALETLPTPSETFEVGAIPSSSCAGSGVPPILIPIYQHAAAAYNLGPQGPAVLAGINEVETAFGTNLNTSSAGAMGWMQFIQSTWEMYGVDANGDGVKDPYNPEDAIFAAARYLSAAGMPADTYGAIYSYNHADWYVSEVLANAACYSGVVGAPAAGASGLSLTPQHEVLSCTPAADWRDAVPGEYMEAFETAAARYELGTRGVWALAAVARLESDFGRGMSKEEMRTAGPLGLDPTEWSTYAVDGDEDGHVRHADPADSAATLARLIWSRGSLQAGIFTHNQAEWYVQAVLADAKQIKGECKSTEADWRVALPGTSSGTQIDWSNLTLSNSLELRDLTTGALDPRIMDLIGMITQQHKITITALRSDHSELTSGGNVSDHYYGRAMDIGSVDGVSCTETSPDAPCGELAHTLSQLPPPLHPTELIYCYDVDGPGPAFSLPDHCDHVHVGFYGE